MSRAPASACASHRKPCTWRPSASSTLPRPSGAGISARNEPTCASGMSQTSSAMAAPPSAHALQAGLGRRGAGQRDTGGSAARCAWLRAAWRRARAAGRSAAGPTGARRPRRAAASAAAGRARLRQRRSRPARPSSARPEAGQRRVVRRRAAMKVTPKGRPAAVRPGRQRQRAPAEQVDEVGVGAQLRVDADRVGIDLGEASGGRARWAPSAASTCCHSGCSWLLQLRAAGIAPAKASVALKAAARCDDAGAPWGRRPRAARASSSRTTPWRSATQGPS